MTFDSSTSPTPESVDPQVSPVPSTGLSHSSQQSPTPPKKQTLRQRSVVGFTWVFAFFALLLLIFLLIFVMQNVHTVEMTVFTWTCHYPLGVGLLLAAIAGALIMTCIGSVRIYQLRKQIKRMREDL